MGGRLHDDLPDLAVPSAPAAGDPILDPLLNPLRSENEAFRLLLRVVAAALVVVVVVLVLRALS